MKRQGTAPLERFPLSVPKNRVKRFIKLAGGSALIRMRPGRAEALRKGEFGGALSPLDRCMLAALGARAARTGTAETLNGVHCSFWASPEGAAHLLRADWRYNELFLKHHSPIIDPVARVIEGLQLTQLIEIGSGTGEVLHHLRARFPVLAEVVGVELNAQLVEVARGRFAAARLRIECGDAREIVPRLMRPRSLLFTNGGVLEYFSGAQVAALFEEVRRAAPAALALVEPFDAAHDLQQATGSRPYGAEMSFSHNYPHLAAQAGLLPWFRREVYAGSERWILFVAGTAPAA